MQLTTGLDTKNINGNLFYQYLATFTGCLSIVCAGMHFGWPSPSLPRLLHPESRIPTSDDDGSWIAAMPCVGALPGALVAAFVVDKIGRRTCMLLTSPLYFATWIMVAYSQSVPMLYAARFLSGASDGVGFTAFPMYIGEIAHPKIRGLLGCSVQVSMAVGMLLINVIGSYLDITRTALVSSAVAVLHFVAFFMMPESPHFSLMRGDHQRAERSLQILYSTEDVAVKLEEVKENVKQDAENGGKFWELFTVRSNRRAVFIVFGLRAVQQFSGTNAMTFYAKTIFNKSEDFPPKVATMIYFGVQLVVATFASFLVDKLGRKPLLIVSIIGSGLALLVEGLYFYADASTYIDLDGLRCIPLVALLGYVVIFNLGLGVIPVLLLGEMFPTSVKAFALCLADIFLSLVVTVISKFFQMAKDGLGLHVPFFTFSCCCALGLAFICLWVPETKGRSLEEIQRHLRRAER